MLFRSYFSILIVFRLKISFMICHFDICLFNILSFHPDDCGVYGIVLLISASLKEIII